MRRCVQYINEKRAKTLNLRFLPLHRALLAVEEDTFEVRSDNVSEASQPKTLTGNDENLPSTTHSTKHNCSGEHNYETAVRQTET